jgi:hypothetical protein
MTRIVLLEDIETNKPIICKDSELATKYSDRWNRLDEFFQRYPSNELIQTSVVRPGELEPGNKFNFSYDSHPYFNISIDTKVQDASIYATDVKNYEFTERKKLYIQDKNIIKYQSYLDQGNDRDQLSEYFIDMKTDFDDVMKYYYDNLYPGIHDKYSFHTNFMAVKYDCPFATSENAYEQRVFNTNIWGPTHCDETLGGLHLGEDVQEFQASYTGEDGEYMYIPDLMKNSTLFFFGEDSVEFGHTPTYHRVIPNPTETKVSRYSIIIDLIAKEKE